MRCESISASEYVHSYLDLLRSSFVDKPAAESRPPTVLHLDVPQVSQTTLDQGFHQELMGLFRMAVHVAWRWASQAYAYDATDALAHAIRDL